MAMRGFCHKRNGVASLRPKFPRASASALGALLLLSACDDKPEAGPKPTHVGGVTARAGFVLAQVLKEHASWTDENIAKDPIGYLTWSLEEFDRLETEFKARQLAMRRSLRELQAKTALETATLERKRELLTTLKAAYRMALPKESFPVLIEGVNQDREQMERLIVETHSSVAKLEAKSARVGVTKAKLDGNLVKIERTLTDLRQRRVELLEKLEQAKLAKTLEDYDGLRDSVDKLLHTAMAVDTDKVEHLTSDDVLALQDGTHEKTAVLEQIMRE